MNYAFIGPGTLGARLAIRLASRFPVTVHDANGERRDAVSASGARWCVDVTAAVAGADAVFTCLPSPDVSRQVMILEGGTLQSMRAGSCWAEISTVGPDDMSGFAESAAQHGIDLMECPVTGGVTRASRGEMTMFVGAGDAVLEKHRDALETMCQPVIHLGAPGSASVTKLITNMLCLVDLIAAGDALLLARQAGLDLDQFYRAVLHSCGNSREFEDWVPRILDGSYDTGFSFDLALKDLGLVDKLAQRLEVLLHLSPEVMAMLKAGRSRFGQGRATRYRVVR